MFPGFRLWGCLKTSSPEQVLRRCSSDHPLVLLVALMQLESVTPFVNRKVVDAHEYYVGLCLHSWRCREDFDLMIRNKSATQLRVPHLLSFTTLFSVNLVLNLHIVLLV